MRRNFEYHAATSALIMCNENICDADTQGTLTILVWALPRLDVEDLASCCCVCKFLKAQCDEEWLWEQLLEKEEKNRVYCPPGPSGCTARERLRFLRQDAARHTLTIQELTTFSWFFTCVRGGCTIGNGGHARVRGTCAGSAWPLGSQELLSREPRQSREGISREARQARCRRPPRSPPPSPPPVSARALATFGRLWIRIGRGTGPACGVTSCPTA